MTALALAVLRAMGWLPLPVLRAVGAALGLLVFALGRRRRHVTQVNLALCYPQMDMAARERLARQVFVRYVQALLDRSWLWHRDTSVVRARVQVTGAVGQALATDRPVIFFVPHFVGLDAGGCGLGLHFPRHLHAIITPQRNAVVEAWIGQGRRRFGNITQWRREAGVKPLLRALQKGDVLHLSPDMNFGTEESIFVPFYGVPAATVPSLSRFARLSGARVHALVTRMTAEGYVVEIGPAWDDFPSEDPVADTALMNQRLAALIDAMPDQYFWPHQRFKSRPPGQAPVY